MSKHISLQELSRQVFKFPGPSVPLAGLHTALEAVEDELSHARDQATLRLYARHKRDAESLHPDDRDLDRYELDVTVEQILPRVFRGGFALTLWSVFEVVVKRMAEYVCLKRGRSIPKWKSRNREDFLTIADKVYKEEVGIEAFPDTTVRRQLNELRQIRNALIHHNGSVAELPESIRALGAEGYAALGLQTYSDLHEEFFVPGEEFLSRNLALVQTYLTSLSENVYTVVHPIPAEDKDV